ncbi:nuclear transport factor 2 family protein [Sneathiella aquimaris]|uniref:nuclear transport factor 2 family protein n=1 Tax=Sneathiella aquimaris TaxID=2599305 RepID=UPI00146A2961|nr:nuclear transport factor 2 family protein [Sneathiella aquimaris]
MIQKTIENWHELLKTKDVAGLDAILHDDVVFHSPVVHTPQKGKQITTLYLAAAFNVLNGDDFKYLREVIGGQEAVLEFQTVIDGITLNGVDMISCDENGLITDFKVMVRPLKAVNLIHQKMGEMLAALGKAS